MAEPINIGGILYEEAGNGQLRVVGYADAPASTVVPPSPFKVQERQREISRQSASDARANSAEQRAEAAAAREAARFAKENAETQTPGDTSLTGDEYLATLPKPLAAQVKALAEGRRAFPTGSALRSPQVQELVAAAAQYDPTLDAANAATRVATRKDFTSGKAAQNITAINTALGHLGTLSKAAGGLDNRSFPMWNTLANFAETQTGDPRVKNFKIARDAVANELMRVFRGTGGSLTEIEEWKRTIDSSDSPEQLKAEISKAVELLNSRLEAMGEQYSKGLGKSADPMKLLNPHAQKVFEALGPGGSGAVPDEQSPKDPNPFHDPDNIGGPGTSGAQGESRFEYDPKASSQIDAMINAGASYAMINEALRKRGLPLATAGSVAKAKKWMKDYPGKAYFGSNIHREVPLTTGQKVSGSPLGSFLAHASDMGTAGGVSAVSGEKGRGALAAMSAMNPNASAVGDLAGGVLGAGTLEAGVAAKAPVALAKYAPRIADALYGGLTGFNQAEEGQGVEGAVGGSVAGLGGGILGNRLARGAGKVVRGVANPAVQRLRAAGIPLTVGEVLGGGAKKAQDALTSLPLIGGRVANRYNEGRRALNETAFNEAGQTVGQPIDAVGQEGIDLLNTAKNQAYADALDPVTLDATNPAFMRDIRDTRMAARAIPEVDNARQIAESGLDNYVADPALASGGALTGRDFQQGYRGLARLGRQSSDRLYGHEIGQVTRQGQDALATALEAQNPGAFQGFLRANSANRHLNILADAVNAAKSQVSDEGEMLFTPAQLGTAATNNAKTFTGKIAAASGDRPFNQLATDAQQVMSSRVPDSGTPARMLMSALATGGLASGGAAGGYGLGGEYGAGVGGLGTILALAAGGSRPAQRLMVNLLTKRPQAAGSVADLIERNARIGGWTGAGVLTPLTVGP